jgi:hypothetical protein
VARLLAGLVAAALQQVVCIRQAFWAQGLAWHGITDPEQQKVFREYEQQLNPLLYAIKNIIATKH